WQVLVVLLMTVHFLLPFFLLLVRQMKRNGKRLMAIAVLLLVMRVADLVWHIIPTFTARLIGAAPEAAHDAHGAAAESAGLLDLWPLLVTLPAIGGLWLALFAWRLSVRGLIPVHELHAPEETRHELAGHAAH